VEANRAVSRRGSHFLDSYLTHGGEGSALCSSRILPPGKFLAIVSLRSSVDRRAIVASGKIRSFEKFGDFFGNRTYYPACSVVPQPTTLPLPPRLGSRN
jgi:hypothetical protein